MQFSVLYHVLPEGIIRKTHWDLFLQFEHNFSSEDKCLLSFETPFPPDQWINDRPVDLVPLPLHRAIYLNYSGSISGSRGSVVRIAGGRILWRKQLERELEFELIPSPGQTPNGWKEVGETFRATHDGGDKWILLRLKGPSPDPIASSTLGIVSKREKGSSHDGQIVD